MLLKKNQLLELTVTGMTGEGNGVARYVGEGIPEPGFVVFVPFTAVGDRILCRIVKVQKNHAFGRVEELIAPSPDRVNIQDCAAFGRCGGCAWRHVTYEAECRYKHRWVWDTLRRVGGLTAEPLPIVACDEPLRYRNKAQYPVHPTENGPVMGFYAPRSHRPVACEDCLLQPTNFRAVLAAIDGWMRRYAVPAYDEQTHSGLVRHVYIRQGAVSGQMMVCLVCKSGKLPAAQALIDAVRAAAPELTSLVVNINPSKTNVILGDGGFTLWGEDAIEDTLCGLRFRLSPHSFYQVNHAQTERLYALVADAAQLSGEEILLDLYCGTGTIGLSMASRVKRLIGVEVVEAAVQDARRNAQANGVDNARFICADAAHAAVQLEREGVRPDVVVLDPPRKGCDAALIDTVAAMQPLRVVYVSCDPATLARDLALFARQGYEVNSVQPVDMFPRTAHVENVACLTKK
ncbi:MAG: 23S rRNA (uracil(1939)-C(5))-methyltransferase RlmD [Clostridia bacterium]|nr:23S rRNA (uracil(1939)-C(5))-methyltransferase RlmD [Clostridia bacterium]